MSVSKKLTFGFLIVLLLSAGVISVGVVGMQRFRQSSSYMYEMRVSSLSYVNSARTAFDKMCVEVRDLVVNSLFDDKKGALDSSNRFEQHAQDFIYWMEQSRAISDTDGLMAFHDRILSEFNEYYLPCARRTIATGIDDIPDHANRFLINAEKAYLLTITDKIDSYMTGLIDLNTALAKQTHIDNTWQTRIYIIWQIMIMGVAVIAATIVARTVIKSIATPILEAEDVLKAIAKGDFSAKIKGSYQGEFATIKKSVNDTADQLSVYILETMQAQETAYHLNIEKARVEASSEAMFAGITYASNIQRNILPPDSVFEKVFSDYAIVWKPRDVVGGDTYWLANFESGSLLCVCDCTGHGTPGALLTMLISSIFNAVVDAHNCNDTAQVVYMLDKQLAEMLNTKKGGQAKKIKDGCDIAALFIAKDGSVTISSAHIRVFVCDGLDVTQVKGQNIYVGEGSLTTKDAVEVITIPPGVEKKFYIASDGLFDQTGGEKGLPFGYKNFMRLILDNHHDDQSVIAQKIWDAVEAYRGDMERLDDFELVTFKLEANMGQAV